MGLFDRFKRDKTNYDVTDMKITDLDENFIFDYDLKTWVVKEVYKYDWGDEFFSYEYKIASDTATRFLSIENDDELLICITDKTPVRKIQEDLPELMGNENAPKKIKFNDKEFYLDEESPGYFCNLSRDKNNWVEFISWTYIDESEKEIISIEQWGEKEFEAAYGQILKPYEISNIIPAEK